MLDLIKLAENINANKTSKVMNFFAKMNQKVSDALDVGMGSFALAA